MSLRNRVALVTGGSRGIGRGLALRLAQDGARMAIAYRSNKVAAQQTLRLLQANGVDCVAVETDITDAGRCDQLIKTVVDRFGRLDVIVNNVGDFRWGTRAESSLWARWARSERSARRKSQPTPQPRLLSWRCHALWRSRKPRTASP